MFRCKGESFCWPRTRFVSIYLLSEGIWFISRLLESCSLVELCISSSLFFSFFLFYFRTMHFFLLVFFFFFFLWRILCLFSLNFIFSLAFSVPFLVCLASKRDLRLISSESSRPVMETFTKTRVWNLTNVVKLDVWTIFVWVRFCPRVAEPPSPPHSLSRVRSLAWWCCGWQHSYWSISELPNLRPM